MDMSTSVSKFVSASAPTKVRMLWMMNMSDAVRVTLHRIFIIGLKAAHQAVIMALKMFVDANIIIIY
jgi:hypothetical protein